MEAFVVLHLKNNINQVILYYGRFKIQENVIIQSIICTGLQNAEGLTPLLNYSIECPSLRPNGIGAHLGRNRLWVRFLVVSDIYIAYDYPPVSSGFSGYIWFDTKIVLKKSNYVCT